MKLLIFIFFLLTMSCSVRNSKSRQIFIQTVGWRFDLSDRIIFNDSAFNSEGQLTQPIPDNGSVLRLFVSKTEKGFLGAFIWKDTLDAKGWKEYHDKDTEWYFDQIRQLPQMILLDTKYSTEKVGKIDFLVRQFKYIKKSTNDTGYSYHYFGKLEDKGLDISFEYYDKELGNIFHQILESSSFSN